MDMECVTTPLASGEPLTTVLPTNSALNEPMEGVQMMGSGETFVDSLGQIDASQLSQVWIQQLQGMLESQPLPNDTRLESLKPEEPLLSNDLDVEMMPPEIVPRPSTEQFPMFTPEQMPNKLPVKPASVKVRLPTHGQTVRAVLSSYREADAEMAAARAPVRIPVIPSQTAVKIKPTGPPTIKSELSSLIKEIHNSVFEEHKLHPAPVWSKRITETCYVDDKKPVPTCVDLLDAHEIDAKQIPGMTADDVAEMVAKLFGPKRTNLADIFREEEIDGASLVMLDLQGYRNLLGLPIGPAVTLDGIVKRAREICNIPAPE